MLMAELEAPEPTDEVLITAVKNGSHNAFELILRRYRDNVYGYMRSLLKDPALADDASQEVFLRMFRAAPHYRPAEGGRFKYWLFTIAANVARNVHRSKKPAVTIDAARDIPAPIQEPSDDAERSERVRQAIESLPEEQKQVVLLKEYQGLKFEEIARLLDISVNTAKSRMRYGLLKLSELLRGYLK
jgi:RNA polymerase sigma-70 factor (ECF subfamily)